MSDVKLSDLIRHMEAGGTITDGLGSERVMINGVIRNKRGDTVSMISSSSWSIVPKPIPPMDIHAAIASGKQWKRKSWTCWVRPGECENRNLHFDRGDYAVFTAADINATDYIVDEPAEMTFGEALEAMANDGTLRAKSARGQLMEFNQCGTLITATGALFVVSVGDVRVAWTVRKRENAK